MVEKEVNAAFRGLEPFLVWLDVVVGCGGDESESALKPHAFGGVDQTSVAIDAGVEAAVFVVHSVLHPKGHDVVHQVVAVTLCPLLEVIHPE